MIIANLVRLFALIAVNAAALWLMFNEYLLAGLVIHLGTVAFLLWGTLSPHSRWFGPIQSEVGDGGVWLTYDDGPDPEGTPKLLDLLDELGVKATFFVVGEKVKQNPDLVRRMAEQGHQIANHTWSHPQATFWCAGPWRTYREIVKCQEAVEEVTGKLPTLFRAPVGHHNVFVHAVLRRFGLSLVGWSSRGFDGVSQGADEVVDRIVGSMQPGGIVLVHEDSAITLEVTQKICTHAREMGWTWINPV